MWTACGGSMKKNSKEEAMEAVLFLCFWLGGAAVHTLVELRWRSSGDGSGEREEAW